MALTRPLLASSGGRSQDRSIGRFVGVHLQDGGVVHRGLDADLHLMEGCDQGRLPRTATDPDLLFKPSMIHGSILHEVQRPEWNPHTATHVPNRRGGISPAGPRPGDRAQSLCRIAVWCREKRHEHRMARCPRSAPADRTVIGVVPDLPGRVEHLPQRSGPQTWRWPGMSEAVWCPRNPVTQSYRRSGRTFPPGLAAGPRARLGREFSRALLPAMAQQIFRLSPSI